MGSELTIGTADVALLAQLLRQIEDNRDRQHMILARQFDKRFACFRLNIGRIDHREPATPSRLRTIVCSKSKASLVAACSFSLSETSPRHAVR